MARKKSTSPDAQGDAAKQIGNALRARPLSPKSRAIKNTNVNIRVTHALKEEMTQLAEQLGVSLTDYIIALHRQAKAILVDREIP